MKPTRIHFGDYFNRLMADPNWVVELKYDGARGMIYVLEDGRVEIWNRHHTKISESRIPDLYEAVYQLALPPGTVLDGEIYPRGVACSQKSARGMYRFALFDMMKVQKPLGERQVTLRDLVPVIEGPVHIVEQAALDEASKREFFQKIWRDERAEGLVMKQLQSRRMDDLRQTRISPLWVKVLKPTKVVA